MLQPHNATVLDVSFVGVCVCRLEYAIRTVFLFLQNNDARLLLASLP